jgi:uncharacterized protein (TIGR03118 family)
MRGLMRSLLPRPAVRPTPRCRPTLEGLEDRCLLAGNVLQTNLVSDLPGVAAFQDPHLVNPWGISESSGSAFWVADNGAGVATLYNTPGQPQSLVVSIPSPDDPLGTGGAPTGTVFNIDGGPTGGFRLRGVSPTGDPASASAVFLFATEDGTIIGWNPGVNPTGFDPTKAGTYGILAVDNSASGAVYKGLAIATNPDGPISKLDPNSQTVLYAANFRSGTIDIFDTNFNPVKLSRGAFTDPKLPKGYAPFNVQVLGNKVYVTYALQDEAQHDDVAGAGHGFIDVFNLDGTPGLDGGRMRLVSRGALDSPWGLAIAPASFGKLAGALLVGNFGDGHIHAYDAKTGAFLATLTDPDGEPIQIDGLWALKVGNGGNGGDADKVYFTAGLDHEHHGLFGSLSPVDAGSPEGDAERQAVIAALDVVQINLNTVRQDIANKVDQATLDQAINDLVTSERDLVRAEITFGRDVLRDALQQLKAAGVSSASAHKLDVDRLFADFRDLLSDLR